MLSFSRLLWFCCSEPAAVCADYKCCPEEMLMLPTQSEKYNGMVCVVAINVKDKKEENTAVVLPFGSLSRSGAAINGSSFSLGTFFPLHILHIKYARAQQQIFGGFIWTTTCEDERYPGC